MMARIPRNIQFPGGIDIDGMAFECSVEVKAADARHPTELIIRIPLDDESADQTGRLLIDPNRYPHDVTCAHRQVGASECTCTRAELVAARRCGRTHGEM